MELKWLSLDGEEPYAAYVYGHVPLEKFMLLANDGWSDGGWADEHNIFYQYVYKKKDGAIDLNFNPQEKGVKPVTIAYWDEPYPTQE